VLKRRLGGLGFGRDRIVAAAWQVERELIGPGPLGLHHGRCDSGEQLGMTEVPGHLDMAGAIVGDLDRVHLVLADEAGKDRAAPDGDATRARREGKERAANKGPGRLG
jgi:hypothetical protein